MLSRFSRLSFIGLLTLCYEFSWANTCGSFYQNSSNPSVRELRNFIFDRPTGNIYVKTPTQKKWVDGQNAKALAILNGTPVYEQLKARNTILAAGSPPARVDTSMGLTYLKAGSLAIEKNGVEVVLVDKATLDGSVVSNFQVSPDGNKIAFSVSKNGSDSNYWSVFDLGLNKVLEDKPIRVRLYEFTWSPESDGFFYSKWPTLEKEYALVTNQAIRTKGIDVAFHKLGSKETDDAIVFKNPFLSSNYAVSKAPDSETYVAHRTKLSFTHKLRALYGHKNASGKIKWRHFNFPTKALGRFVYATSEFSVFLSSEVGNNYGLVAYSNTSGKFLKVILPAKNNKILSQVQKIGNAYVAQYFDKKFINTIEIYDLNGKLTDLISMEKLGLAGRGALPATINVRPGSDRFELTYHGIEQPSVTIAYNVTTKDLQIRKSALANTFDKSVIASKVINVKTESGVEVPVQLYSKAGAEPKFAYLSFYGSNGVVNTSVFNRKFQMLLEMGAVVVLVGPRGGGDKGARWYDEGMDDRMNTVDDVSAVSRWVKKQYPSINDQVAGSGRSFGGMLAYALAVHAPKDFSVLIPVVGIADLNYFKSDYFGSILWDDLGYNRNKKGQLIVDEKTQRNVRRFSPYLNTGKMKSSPAIMSFVNSQDERVGPHQGYVMTKALQDRFPENSIYMLEQPGGHLARSEAAEEVAFIAHTFGLTELDVIFK